MTPTREINAAAAIGTLRTGAPLESAHVSGALNLRELCPPEPPRHWWQRSKPGRVVSVPIVIRSCVVEEFVGIALAAAAPIVIEDTVVSASFALHSFFFNGGLQARRCRFEGDATISHGGHNASDAPFVLESCRFERFVDFNDEWFKGPVIVRDCTFVGGSNLLGMRGRRTPDAGRRTPEAGRLKPDA